MLPGRPLEAVVQQRTGLAFATAAAPRTLDDAGWWWCSDKPSCSSVPTSLGPLRFDLMHAGVSRRGSEPLLKSGSSVEGFLSNAVEAGSGVEFEPDTILIFRPNAQQVSKAFLIFVTEGNPSECKKLPDNAWRALRRLGCLEDGDARPCRQRGRGLIGQGRSATEATSRDELLREMSKRRKVSASATSASASASASSQDPVMVFARKAASTPELGVGVMGASESESDELVTRCLA